ncbi:MAG: cold shock domain-containing protein [Rhodospirillales bacterium]|jgi:CspA family cold shock protein
MTNGTVMWFDIRKGLGFIEPDDGSAGTFVTDLAVERAGFRSLTRGQKVTYDRVIHRSSAKQALENLRVLA